MKDRDTGIRAIDRKAVYREDGTRKSEDELLRELGPIGTRLVLLGDAVHRRLSKLQTEVNYPPKLFLSYKWGDEEENALVHGIADKLRRNGWDVVCDASRDEEVDRTVEDFVSRLVNCKVFAAIIDSAYLEHAVNPRRPSWVFDEYQFALRANDAMHLIALWRGGEERPKFPLVFDLRGEDDAGVEELLEKHLRYDGPTLDQSERDRVRAVMEDVLSNKDRLADQVLTLREELKRNPFVHGQYQVGNQLDNAGELWAARNHLRLACGDPNVSTVARNALGVVYLGLGFLDRAAECFQDVLRVEPQSDMARRNLERAKTGADPRGIRHWKQLEGRLTGCDNCESVYFLSKDRPLLCYGCGAHRPFEPDACPYCGLAQGLDGVVGFMKVDGRFRPTPCPTCKSGQLTVKEAIEI